MRIRLSKFATRGAGRVRPTRHLTSVLAIGILLLANAYMAALVFVPDTASAHSNGYHWHGKGVRILNDANNTGPSNDAINEWHNETIIYVYGVTSDEEIYVFDNDGGATGYCGAWAPQVYSGTNHLAYGRAVYNEYCGLSYNGKRAVFCQEVGHGFGLAHSKEGCMGYGYTWDGVRSTAYTVWQHNIDDIYGIYNGHGL